MPYIITTTSAYAHPSKSGTIVPHTTRTAVGTLEEARHQAWGVVQGRNWQTDVSTYQSASDKARVVPPEGGTVGPLPDGTIIEVERVDTIKCPGNEFHGSCGKPAHWRHGVSLGRLYANGAYECSDTRCWTMTTLDAVQA